MAEKRKPKREQAAESRSPGRGGDLDSLIVDTAVELAEEVGWDAVRLRRVADRLGVPLTEVLARYRDLDTVADAWFGRACEAMLATPGEDFAALPARERVYRSMLLWFDALAGHRRVTGQMLRAKLYPSHPHHWVPLAFNLSRTVHWLREAAILDATGRRRQMEEVGLSALFLATLARWLDDASPDQEFTRAALGRRLDGADRLMAWLWAGRRDPPGDRPGEPFE